MIKKLQALAAALLARSGAAALVEHGQINPPHPLLKAARRGNLDRVQALVTSGASINTRGRHQYTPLMFAAKNGHAEVVKFLLDAGARVSDIGANGATALLLADQGNHAEIVEELLRASRAASMVQVLDAAPTFAD